MEEKKEGKAGVRFPGILTPLKTILNPNFDISSVSFGGIIKKKRIKMRNKLPFFFILIMPIFLCSCAVIMNLNPMTPSEEESCKPHPNFTSFKIKKIAVLDFANSDKKVSEKIDSGTMDRILKYDKCVYLSDNDGSIVAGLVEDSLMQGYKYEVVYIRKPKEILKEQNLQLSGLVIREDAVKIGKLACADAVLTGRVVEANANFETKKGVGGLVATYIAYVTLEMRLVDVTTARVIWSCLFSRSTLNYLAQPIAISNYEVLKNPHCYDIALGGSSAQERITSVLKKAVKEAIKNIL